ncbi:MAG: LCP family protein [Ruminococcus sp.]
MGERLINKIRGILAGIKEDFLNHVWKASEQKGKAAVSAATVILMLVGLGGAFLYGKGHNYFQQSNYVEASVKKVEMTPRAEEEPVDEQMAQIQENLERYRTSENVMTEENVYNILLVGVDRTATTEEANSDSMILLSINYEKMRVTMMSLMRDTYVHIPGVGYRKLNAAYANGGGELLAETVTENFKVQVNRYMAVSFKDMIQIIDAVGAVSLNFSEAEAENANTTMLHMCQNMGIEEQYEKYKIPGKGTYQCNGLQTVAYARIRKVGNADYERTERQREVLTKLIRRIRLMKISEIDRLASKLLPHVTHNIPESEFWALLGKVPSMINYEVVKTRLPYDGLFYSSGEYLIPDWEETYLRLQEELYGKND